MPNPPPWPTRLWLHRTLARLATYDDLQKGPALLCLIQYGPEQYRDLFMAILTLFVAEHS